MQKSLIQLTHYNHKGQVLPYFLIMAMVLLLSWAMLVNIAKVIRDKMVLQNELDNAVISVANLQARTLNLLGITNHLIATILSTTAYPMIAMFPTFSTDTVGGSLIPGPFCDYKCTGGFHTSTQFSGVKKIKQTINTIQKVQDNILNSYLLNYVLLTKSFSKNDNKIVIVPSRFYSNIKNINFNSIDPQSLLGIKRNTKEIKYYKTVNVCMDLKSKHYHLVYPQYYQTDKYSWYIQNEDFDDKKLIGFATKISKSSSNDNYPLFSKIFNIKMPTLYAISSAGLYNSKGAMFSNKETNSTGVSNTTLLMLSPMIAKQIKVFTDIVQATAKIPIIGEIVATAEMVYALYYLEQVVEKSVTEPKNEDTPIYKYNEAELGGWDAHLVPLKVD